MNEHRYQVSNPPLIIKNPMIHGFFLSVHYDIWYWFCYGVGVVMSLPIPITSYSQMGTTHYLMGMQSSHIDTKCSWISRFHGVEFHKMWIGMTWSNVLLHQHGNNTFLHSNDMLSYGHTKFTWVTRHILKIGIHQFLVHRCHVPKDSCYHGKTSHSQDNGCKNLEFPFHIMFLVHTISHYATLTSCHINATFAPHHITSCQCHATLTKHNTKPHEHHVNITSHYVMLMSCHIYDMSSTMVMPMWQMVINEDPSWLS